MQHDARHARRPTRLRFKLVRGDLPAVRTRKRRTDAMNTVDDVQQIADVDQAATPHRFFFRGFFARFCAAIRMSSALARASCAMHGTHVGTAPSRRKAVTVDQRPHHVIGFLRPPHKM
jgi:hypothetical protein